MIESIVKLSLLPFSFPPVQVCCGFTFVVSLFGLIARFIHGDFSFKR